MQEGLIKGTGNSRYLKSSIQAGTTWEQALAMLTAGTFPIDLNGINAAGWEVIADALNKANLLPDSVAAALGLTGNPQVKDALLTLATAKPSVTGSYVGDGTYGSSNPTTLTLGFKPTLIVIHRQDYAEYKCVVPADINLAMTYRSLTGSPVYMANFSWDSTGVSLCTTISADAQLNYSGSVYRYTAFK